MSAPRLLVVDDEPSMRVFLEVLLTKAGYQLEVAADLTAAQRAWSGGDFDLVITDLRLGKKSGLDLLKKVKAERPETEVIVMTAFASDEGDLQAMRMGAYDYVAKPFKNDELLLLVGKALEKRALAQRGQALARDNELLREQLAARGRFEQMVGRSAALLAVFETIEKVAAARTTVLITGESGVGKELVARAVHQRSPRSAGPFVPVNCGAIPEGLIESELFGHVKGAFTGAGVAKRGLFQTAEGGTLFLDEIGELPPALQVKLLRALQERRIRPVGDTQDLEVDARLVAATNRNLEQEMRAGRFREDLFYRLNVVQIRVPPLRDRREDLMPLAEHFLKRFAAEHGRKVPRLTAEAMARLDEYAFPGNVRELENLIERAVALSTGEEISVDALPAVVRRVAPLPAEGPLPERFSLEGYLEAIERELIDRALGQAHGVKKDAAALLGMTFRQFRHRVKRLADEPADESDGEE
jgi:two-component system response regulator PilR (NtrC family)